MDHRGCCDRPRAGPWRLRCNCRPAADWGHRPDIGSVLTSVAIWRAGRWTGWRRYAPAIWTVYFFVTIGAAVAAIPSLSIPAVAPNPAAPSPPVEALWQAAWFLLSLALSNEAGRKPGSA